jgi:hypothetical protein
MTLVEDYLENDDPIPGQKFGCISFVSPDSMVEKRELFYMKEFFKKTSQELGIEKDKALEFLKKYDDFKFGNEDTLMSMFNEQNEGACNIYGFKVRGVYDTEREARVRAEVLRRRDPNFNVFVFQPGFWCPWHPKPQQVAEEEFAETQLNELVKNYKINQKQKDDYFATESRERSEAARKDGKPTLEDGVITIGDKPTNEESQITEIDETQQESDSNLNEIKKEIFE